MYPINGSLNIWNCCTYLQYVIYITQHVNRNFICNKSKNFQTWNDFLNKYPCFRNFIFVPSEGSI